MSDPQPEIEPCCLQECDRPAEPGLAACSHSHALLDIERHKIARWLESFAYYRSAADGIRDGAHRHA